MVTVHWDARANQGTPGDGRRLGSQTPRLLTGARGLRSSPEELAGSEGMEGVRRPGFRALRAAENAGAARRRSGASPPSPPCAGGRRKPARSWRSGVNRASTRVKRAVRRSGRGNRAVLSVLVLWCRLQRSVRGIFPMRHLRPRGRRRPRRVARIGSSRDREPARFGRQGCRVIAREPDSQRARSRPGSDVGYRAD